METFQSTSEEAAQFLNICNEAELLHLEPIAAVIVLSKRRRQKQNAEIMFEIMAEVLYDPMIPNSQLH